MYLIQLTLPCICRLCGQLAVLKSVPLPRWLKVAFDWKNAHTTCRWIPHCRKLIYFFSRQKKRAQRASALMVIHPTMLVRSWSISFPVRKTRWFLSPPLKATEWSDLFIAKIQLSLNRKSAQTSFVFLRVILKMPNRKRKLRWTGYLYKKGKRPFNSLKLQYC